MAVLLGNMRRAPAMSQRFIRRKWHAAPRWWRDIVQQIHVVKSFRCLPAPTPSAHAYGGGSLMDYWRKSNNKRYPEIARRCCGTAGG